MATKDSPPLVKTGDKLYVIAARNSQMLTGQIVTVNAGYNTRIRRSSIAVRDENGKVYTLYYSGPADEFIIATRDSMKKALKQVILDLETAIKEKREEYDRLEKFATDEEEVAFKLDQILVAHGSSKTSKSRISAIAKLLKEMKKTNYI